MRSYLDLMQKILSEGKDHDDRTGTGTLSLFGEQLKFDLKKGFPLLTTKKMGLRWVAEELVWFLSGSTYEPDLANTGVDIWREWADKDGELGPVYSHNWRNFGAKKLGAREYPRRWDSHNRKVVNSGYDKYGVDQIRILQNQIVENPGSRRLIVSAWNPAEIKECALPACHTFFQVKLDDIDKDTESLSLHMYQRSADYFLGVPFNIASYALLTHLLAWANGIMPGTLTISFGDVHLYKNHLEQAKLQLSREPFPLPKLSLSQDIYNRGFDSIMDFRSGHATLDGYKSHPKIEADVSV